MTANAPDRLRHDIWTQLDKLQTQIEATTDPHQRQQLEASRRNYQAILDKMPAAPTVQAGANLQAPEPADDAVLQAAWSDILGEANLAVAAMP